MTACTPLTQYQATLMYLDAVGITGYVEHRNFTPFQDAIVLRAECCSKVVTPITYRFDILDGSLLEVVGSLHV